MTKHQSNTNHLWDAWSSHTVTFHSSYLAQLGRNLRPCCSIYQSFQATLSRSEGRSCRQKSTLFTNTLGALESALFSVLFGTLTLLRVNSDFAPSKPRLYSV